MMNDDATMDPINPGTPAPATDDTAPEETAPEETAAPAEDAAVV